MTYLIHHTLNRKKKLYWWEPNTVSFDEKSLIDKSQCKKNSETKKSTFCPFKTNGRKCDFALREHLRVHKVVLYLSHTYFHFIYFIHRCHAQILYQRKLNRHKIKILFEQLIEIFRNKLIICLSISRFPPFFTIF